MSEVELVLVGSVTLDRMPGGFRPGGAAFYASWTAHRLGLRVGLLTSLGPDFPDDALPPGLALATIQAPRTTAFEHGAGSGGRRLALKARSADIETDDLPPEWRRAALALLCPVAGEVDPGLAGCFPEASLAVAPQGWMREHGAEDAITPRAWASAALVLPHAQVLVVSEEDVAARPEDTLDWVQRVPLAAVTRGARGATLFVNGEAYGIAPDVAVERDATGAGDVFATALLIEYHRRGDPWDAAAAAACAAAASVEGPGASAVPDRRALEERLRAYHARLSR